MSRPGFWLRIEYQRWISAAWPAAVQLVNRNAENEGGLVPTESRSSILGGPVEPNLRDKVQK